MNIKKIICTVFAAGAFIGSLFMSGRLCGMAFKNVLDEISEMK